MSAYIEDAKTIATIAASIAIVVDQLSGDKAIIGAANKYAKLLHDENVTSVNYRYSDDTKPDQIQVTAGDVEAARAQDLGTQLDAISSLVYQSCEHPQWVLSEANQTLQNYRLECIAPTEADDLPHNSGALIGSAVSDGRRSGFIVGVTESETRSYSLSAGLKKANSQPGFLLCGYQATTSKLWRARKTFGAVFISHG